MFAFGVVIFVHEFGHFIIARLNKINVSVFSIGFGPRLISGWLCNILESNVEPVRQLEITMSSFGCPSTPIHFACAVAVAGDRWQSDGGCSIGDAITPIFTRSRRK